MYKYSIIGDNYIVVFIFIIVNDIVVIVLSIICNYNNSW